MKSACALSALVLALGSACGSTPAADTVTSMLARGDDFAGRRRFPEAIIEYRKAVQSAPQSGAARLRLATSLLELNDLKGGAREYFRAADLLPDDPAVQVRAGGLALIQGRFDEAAARAKQVLAGNPRHVDAQILAANAKAGLKDVDSAIADVEQAIVLDPGRASSYTNLADLQIAAGQMADAEASFRKAVSLSPDSAQARLSLASFYWASRRRPEAEQTLKDALTRTPENVAVNRALALFAVVGGEPQKAEPYLQTIARVARTPDAKLSLANFYVLMKRHPEATALLTELATQDDTFAAATSRLATLALASGDTQDAGRLATAVLARHPKHVGARLIDARLHAAAGRLDQALASATIAADGDPRSPQAWYLIGLLNLSRQDSATARQALSEAAKLDPRATDAQLLLARLSLSQGGMAAAARFAEEALSASSDNATAQLLLARTSLARGDIERAARLLTTLEREHPTSAGVHATLGAISLLRKDEPAARRALTRSLALDPLNLEALSGLITLDVAAGRIAEARARLDDRLARRADPSAVMLAASTHASTGQAKQAETLLLRLVDQEPTNLQAYAMLARLYATTNRIGEARRQLQVVIAQKPQSLPTRTLLGMLSELEGKAAEAIATYEQVLAQDPKSPVAANNLAWLLLQSGGDTTRAFELAQSAKAILPNDPHVNDTLGWAYVQKGLFASAVPLLEQSVAAAPTNATAQLHLGLARVRDGRLSAGRTALREAVRLQPALASQPDVRQALGPG